jgi:hypothetical protein
VSDNDALTLFSPLNVAALLTHLDDNSIAAGLVKAVADASDAGGAVRALRQVVEAQYEAERARLDAETAKA